jgi:hypothetical protein
MCGLDCNRGLCCDNGWNDEKQQRDEKNMTSHETP